MSTSEIEAGLRALAEASPAGIFILRDGRLSYVNPALVAITGFRRDELIGMDPYELVPLSDREAARSGNEAWLSGETVPSRREMRIVTRRGEDRWIDLTLAPFAHEGGGAVIGTAIDITDHKHLEGRMQRRQQLEAVGRLSAGVAHDFNNLLLVISGEIERVSEALAQDHPLRRSVEAISRAAARATALTQHLMAFGRQQTLILRPVDVNAVIRELGAVMWDAAGKGVAPTTDLAPDLPPANFDRTRLEQVLLSLVANAREAMGQRGSITIRTDLIETDEAMRRERSWLPHGWWVRIQVADTGPGIPPDVLPRVFEPFFTTKRDSAGSGFGLSSVYGVVKQSAGFVWIDSQPGDGTTVTILLPPAAAAAERPAAGMSTPASRAHVLLVEDQEGVRDLLTAVLKRSGFDVTSAATAEEALEKAPSLNFDLLLTDVVLPGMTGPEMVRRLRLHAPGIRVLFMSGYTGDALRDHADFRDERAFIQKPFATRALVERIRLLLEEANPAAEDFPRS